MPTEAEFIAGKPLAYKSFSGADCTATFATSPAPHLTICNAAGRQVTAPVMPEYEARNFYREIAAELGQVPA